MTRMGFDSQFICMIMLEIMMNSYWWSMKPNGDRH